MTGRDSPDPAGLARDWVTMWQSEVASLAADREVQEGWQRMAALWAAHMNAAISAWSRIDPASGRSGAAPPAGPPPAAAAPDAGELARLRDRVAELEQRLAELERGR